MDTNCTPGTVRATTELTAATVAVLDDLLAGTIDADTAVARLVADAEFSADGAAEVVADPAWSRAIYTMVRDHRSGMFTTTARQTWAGYALPGTPSADPWTSVTL